MIAILGRKLAEELIAESEFKPSHHGDFHCGTETNLLLHAACETITGNNSESNLHALLRGFHEQIVKHYSKLEKKKPGE